VFLVDTDVISELRKGSKANGHVRRFFDVAAKENHGLYLSVVTIGELRRGVELLRHRNDIRQAQRLEAWLESLVGQYADHILDFASEEAQIWGRLRVPHPENAIDKQIAATALIYDFKLVTGNVRHFEGLGVALLNPFTDPNE
jgi:predicted nucleic acid-binding protein